MQCERLAWCHLFFQTANKMKYRKTGWRPFICSNLGWLSVKLSFQAAFKPLFQKKSKKRCRPSRTFSSLRKPAFICNAAAFGVNVYQRLVIHLSTDPEDRKNLWRQRLRYKIRMCENLSCWYKGKLLQLQLLLGQKSKPSVSKLVQPSSNFAVFSFARIVVCNLKFWFGL